MNNLKEKIESTKKSIVAIGFKPTPDKVTIIGSGFAVGKKGTILSVAHVYSQVSSEHRNSLMGMAMVEQASEGLERYEWLPLKLIKKEDKDDVAYYRIENYDKTLLEPLKIGDSEQIEVGDEAYFIGFPYAAQLINDGFGITLITNQTMISNIKRDGVIPSHPKNWFIVDAISNPGNSGSPLIDLKTNKVIGIMSIAFRTKSQTVQELDIREPMHIAGAKPINLAKNLL